MTHGHGVHEAIVDTQPHLKTTCGRCRRRHFRRNAEGMKVVCIACLCGNILFPWGEDEKGTQKDLREHEATQRSRF